MGDNPPSSPILDRRQRYRWIWAPLLIFAITRLGIFLVAYVSAPLIADSQVPPYHIKPDNLLLDVFGSRWDTGFYLSIADEGYKYEDVQFPSVAFFPLFPLFIRLLTVFLSDSLISGVLIANLALALAVILFYRLIALEADERIATRAVWYLLIFPTSFFGSAIYTESLFLLFTIGAFFFYRKRFWESSAMFAFFAGLTRLMGLILAPALLVEWFTTKFSEPDRGRRKWLGLLPVIAVPVGTLSYMLYLEIKFKDALGFMTASAAWERGPSSPLATMVNLLQRPGEGWLRALLAGRIQTDNWMDFLFIVLFLFFGVALLIQRRWSEAVFVLLGVFIPFSSGLLMSQRRYMWILFPAFSLLARWGENAWIDRLVTAFSLVGLGIYTAMFANWYWVG